MAPPSLNLPVSPSTVVLSAINTTTDMVVPASGFIEPVIPGHELWNLHTLAFLIENKALGKSILFDCGSRKDWWNFSPLNVNVVENLIPGLDIKKGVDEILTEGGVSLDSIDHIIWSHHHWDHTGDPNKFPKKTGLVVGPGFKKAFMPGYPANPSSPMLETDFEGREVLEVTFNTGLKIGQFRAIDFLGDGSFYILDVPGHAIGHISGLARVTPSTFVFLGGDVCHYGGSFRPTEWKPMPSTIPSSAVLDARFRLPCPCSIFTHVHPLNASDGEEVAKMTPYHKVTRKEGSWYLDPPIAQESVDRLAGFDASDDVFVAIAHDGGLLDVINFFPNGTMNQWQAKGWKEKSHWGFLNELPVEGGPMPPIAPGLIREGKLLKPLKM